MEMCPCGSGQPLEECCLPYIKGEAPAPTAEALLRARYTAHCLHDVDYLNATMHPDTKDDLSKDELRDWVTAVDWRGLQILELKQGKEHDERGEIALLVDYAIKGMPQQYREDAFFSKENGIWYYVDGVIHGPKPFRRDTPKVGRNEPCPCGSGKKYKKCCGAIA